MPTCRAGRLSSPANKPPITLPTLCRPKQQRLGKNNPRKVSGVALCPEFVTHFKSLQGPLSESRTFKVTWVLFNSQRGSFFKLQTMFQLWRMFWVSLIKDMQLTQEFCFVRKASGCKPSNVHSAPPCVSANFKGRTARTWWICCMFVCLERGVSLKCLYCRAACRIKQLRLYPAVFFFPKIFLGCSLEHEEFILLVRKFTFVRFHQCCRRFNELWPCEATCSTVCQRKFECFYADETETEQEFLLGVSCSWALGHLFQHLFSYLFIWESYSDLTFSYLTLYFKHVRYKWHTYIKIQRLKRTKYYYNDLLK